MKLASFPIILFCLLFFFDCASTRGTFYNRKGIALVNTWLMVYSSETGGVDPAGVPQDQFGTPTESTQLKSDLQLSDHIFLRLRKKFGISVTTDPTQADGQIRLHAVKYVNGGVRSLDIALYDRNNQLLAHTGVSNRGQQNVFDYDDDFAEYAAETIAELLGSK